MSYESICLHCFKLTSFSWLQGVQPVHPQRKSVLNIHWKDWCWSCSSNAKNWLIGKDPDAENDWRQEEKGMPEDEMVGWHHQLDVHEFEQALGVGDGQGSLVCCSPWGHRVGHDWATELTHKILNASEIFLKCGYIYILLSKDALK